MKMLPCHNCGSAKLDFSFGALFGGCSIFCKRCGCKGGMSDTEPRQPNQKIRMQQARKEWNKTLVEWTAWESKGGIRTWPPKPYTALAGEGKA
jgi:hypothetical protein